MLSKTIRNADVDKINEFDLETWAHEARKLEDSEATWRGMHESDMVDVRRMKAENAELREQLKVVTDAADGWILSGGHRAGHG